MLTSLKCSKGYYTFAINPYFLIMFNKVGNLCDKLSDFESGETGGKNLKESFPKFYAMQKLM